MPASFSNKPVGGGGLCLDETCSGIEREMRISKGWALSIGSM
jgi:hypothetical protein